jgi:2-dehydropantoate 2-reductase
MGGEGNETAGRVGSEAAEGAERVLVVGCGGIGGIVAAGLLEHDRELVHPPLVYTTNLRVAEAVQDRGFRLTGVGGERVVGGPVCTELPDSPASFDWILLATPPTEVEVAALLSRHLLSPRGAFVTFQNGLCEERVAALAGPERVVGGIVVWGASMPEPGLFERTSAGGFTLGRLDGTIDPRLERLGLLLEIVGPTTITRNLRGARWSKLAINCAISTLGTIGGDRLGVLLRMRAVRRLALEIMTEAVQVARAEGVTLEKVAGALDLDWLALTEVDKSAESGSASLVAKHALLLAVGTRYRRMRSSMLAAIERGRTPPVDYLNGEVSSRGRIHGIPTPVNDAAGALVHRIARGEARSSHDSLRELAREVGVLGA